MNYLLCDLCINLLALNLLGSVYLLAHSFDTKFRFGISGIMYCGNVNNILQYPNHFAWSSSDLTKNRKTSSPPTTITISFFSCLLMSEDDMLFTTENCISRSTGFPLLACLEFSNKSSLAGWPSAPMQNPFK